LAIDGMAAISSGSCATTRISPIRGLAATLATTRSIIGMPPTGTTHFCATPARSASGSSTPERLPAMIRAVTLPSFSLVMRAQIGPMRALVTLDRLRH
tara:strand:- start:70 stop:363 length:294 start_codon:yes stop_codon:yes gene_type:complete